MKLFIHCYPDAHTDGTEAFTENIPAPHTGTEIKDINYIENVCVYIYTSSQVTLTAQSCLTVPLSLSLTIYSYRTLSLVKVLDGTQRPHRFDVCNTLLVGQNWYVHV